MISVPDAVPRHLVTVERVPLPLSHALLVEFLGEWTLLVPAAADDASVPALTDAAVGATHRILSQRRERAVSA